MSTAQDRRTEPSQALDEFISVGNVVSLANYVRVGYGPAEQLTGQIGNWSQFLRERQPQATPPADDVSGQFVDPGPSTQQLTSPESSAGYDIVWTSEPDPSLTMRMGTTLNVLGSYADLTAPIISNWTYTNWPATAPSFRLTFTPIWLWQLTENLREPFNELADTWKRSTAMMAQVQQKSMHWTYQQIIGMGPMVVPLILELLRDRGPDHWFWALAMITREDVAAGASTLREATDRWVAWGRERELV